MSAPAVRNSTVPSHCDADHVGRPEPPVGTSKAGAVAHCSFHVAVVSWGLMNFFTSISTQAAPKCGQGTSSTFCRSQQIPVCMLQWHEREGSSTDRTTSCKTKTRAMVQRLCNIANANGLTKSQVHGGGPGVNEGCWFVAHSQLVEAQASRRPAGTSPCAECSACQAELGLWAEACRRVRVVLPSTTWHSGRLSGPRSHAASALGSSQRMAPRSR